MGFAFSLVLTLLMLPPLIRMAKVRGLFVPTNYRKVHKEQVSALGGLAIFTSVLISFLLFVDTINFPDVRYVTATTLLMFFVGLRDDFHPVSVKVKLISQLLAVLVLVLFADIRIDFLSDIFDGSLGVVLDILLTVFLMLWIINSFNFIDGIDLLASLYAFIVFVVLGVWFLLTDQFDYSLLLLSLSGAFLAFMIFNYSPSKIFMGDTGTLSVGLLMAITLLKFDDVNTLISGSPYQFHSAPGLAFGFIAVPFIDSARVAIIRISRGVSPFKADKNHIHHLFLRLGWKHNKVALFLGLVFIIILSINFVLDHFYISSWGIILVDISLILIMYALLYRVLKTKKDI